MLNWLIRVHQRKRYRKYCYSLSFITKCNWMSKWITKLNCWSPIRCANSRYANTMWNSWAHLTSPSNLRCNLCPLSILQRLRCKIRRLCCKRRIGICQRVNWHRRELWSGVEFLSELSNEDEKLKTCTIHLFRNDHNISSFIFNKLRPSLKHLLGKFSLANVKPGGIDRKGKM